MKKIAFIRYAFTLLIGMIAGSLITLIVLSSNGMLQLFSGTMSDEPIDKERALFLLRNYRENDQSQSKFRAIRLERSHLDAARKILSDDKIPSCRICYGMDEKAGVHCVVIGVDQYGNNLYQNMILLTKRGAFDPCPTICDQSSD